MNYTTANPDNSSISTTEKPAAGFGHPSSSRMSEGAHTFLIVVYALLSVVGISGNMFVCYVLGVKKQKFRKGDIYIISLSVADLISSIIWPIHMIPYHSFIYTDWFYKWGPQGTFYFLFYSTCMVSSWQLLLIAIDRYWAITKILWWKSISLWKKVAAVIFIWIGAFLIKFPLTWRMDLFKYGDRDYKIYLMVWTIVGWIIPVIVIIILYTLSVRVLIKQQNTQKGLGREAERRRRDNMRVVKMFIIIVILYFTFTIPHSISDLFRYIYDGSPSMVVIHEILVILVLINSCTNPFIYAGMHPDVKRYILEWKKKAYATHFSSESSVSEPTSQDSVL